MKEAWEAHDAVKDHEFRENMMCMNDRLLRSYCRALSSLSWKMVQVSKIYPVSKAVEYALKRVGHDFNASIGVLLNGGLANPESEYVKDAIIRTDKIIGVYHQILMGNTPQFIYTNRMTYEYNPITMEYEVIEGA